MTEQELISMILNEITEYELEQYRKENNKSYITLISEISALSAATQKILSKISSDEAQTIDKYITKSAELADKDCVYLYMQGAKDCVKLLKRLGVI